MTNQAGRPAQSITIETKEPMILFTNAGTVYHLDADLGQDGRLVMSRRDKALALALLSMAQETVQRSVTA